MKKLLVLLIGLFVFPLCTYAINECNATSTLSYNVNISYIVNSASVQPSFKIYVTNLTSDMIVIDQITSKVYKGFSTEGSSLEIDTTNSGGYSFDIYSVKCKVKTRTISVNLPTYNKYYNDERCKGYQNYSICKRWSSYDKDEKTFENDLNQLKESIRKQQEKDKKQNNTEKKEDDLVHKVLNVLIKYWWEILIGLALIIILIVANYKKKKKEEFNFKL